MATLGILFLVVLGLVLLVALYVLVRSIPDINRYRRVRKM